MIAPLRTLCPALLGFVVGAVFQAHLSAQEGDRDDESVQRISEQRWVYEVLDEVRVLGPGGQRMEWASNALLVVQVRGNVVMLTTRPDAERPTAADGDSPANQLRLRYNGNEQLIPLPAVRVRLRFEPGERGSIDVAGVGHNGRELAEGLMAQGPSANVLTSGAEIPYAVQVMIEDELHALRGFQTNGDLWVDLTFSPIGDAEIGGDGWQLPMQLRLPEQSVSDSVQIAAQTALNYSSVRIGPENNADSILAIQSNGWQIQRRNIVRPALVTLPDNGPSQVVGVRDASHSVGETSRALLLSLWGVQRVAGLREVGIAQWLSAAVADTQAEEAAVAIAGAMDVLNQFDATVPRMSAPPRGTVAASEHQQIVEQRDALQAEVNRAQEELEGARIALAASSENERWRWYAEADSAVYTVESESEVVLGRDSEAIAGGVSGAFGVTVGDQWRIGPMLTLRSIAADSDAVAHTIVLGGGHIRADYVGESFHGYLSVGVETGFVRIRAHASADGTSGGLSFTSDTDPLAGSVGIGGSLRLSESFGVGVAGQLATDGEFILLTARPSLIWFAGDRTEVRFSGAYLDMEQELSIAGGDDVFTTTMSGFGGGIGVGVRW